MISAAQYPTEALIFSQSFVVQSKNNDIQLPRPAYPNQLDHDLQINNDKLKQLQEEILQGKHFSPEQKTGSDRKFESPDQTRPEDSRENEAVVPNLSTQDLAQKIDLFNKIVKNLENQPRDSSHSEKWPFPAPDSRASQNSQALPQGAEFSFQGTMNGADFGDLEQRQG